MLFILKVFLTAAFGYFIGSINSAVIISKSFLHGDIRDLGSNNAGTTNMARVYGLGLGALTLVFDIIKSVLSILLGKALLGDFGFALGAIACMAGHCWPVFFNFRGGKGVAVCAGIMIMLGWKFVVALIGLFFIIAFFTKYVSLGSLIGILFLPLALFLFGRFSVWYYIMAVLMIVIVWYMHRSNIKRLLNGTENKFKPGKRK